jgi:hypothetical protein
MADNSSTDDWSDILSERIAHEQAETSAAEAHASGHSAGHAPPPGPVSRNAIPGAAPPPGRPPGSPGPAYGGITTGWKTPDTGGLPAARANAIPAAGAGPRVSGSARSAGTSPELVVRELTRQISARQETRAIDILRGGAGAGSRLGLGAIIVLSAAAVFAGTYLWTQAVRERGALRVAERGVRAPEETEPAVAETGPATVGTRPPPPLRGRAGVRGDERPHSPLPRSPSLTERGDGPSGRRISQGTRSGPLQEKKVGPVVVKKTPLERPSRAEPVPEQPVSKGDRRERLEIEDDDAPVFVIGAPAPSSGGRSRPRTDEWAELGGPLFE